MIWRQSTEFLEGIAGTYVASVIVVIVMSVAPTPTNAKGQGQEQDQRQQHFQLQRPRWAVAHCSGARRLAVELRTSAPAVVRRCPNQLPTLPMSGQTAWKMAITKTSAGKLKMISEAKSGGSGRRQQLWAGNMRPLQRSTPHSCLRKPDRPACYDTALLTLTAK